MRASLTCCLAALALIGCGDDRARPAPPVLQSVAGSGTASARPAPVLPRGSSSALPSVSESPLGHPDFGGPDTRFVVAFGPTGDERLAQFERTARSAFHRSIAMHLKFVIMEGGVGRIVYGWRGTRALPFQRFTKLREHYGVKSSSFASLLVDVDGVAGKRWARVPSVEDLFAEVDELPSRKLELERRKRPMARRRRTGSCGLAEVERCVARFVHERQSSLQVATLFATMLSTCFGAVPKQELFQADGCFPLELGQDARNAFDLQVTPFCSDLCPQQLRMLVLYAGVNEHDCCAMKGVPTFDPAWGRYVGCAPPEAPRQRRIEEVAPGRYMWVLRDRCTNRRTVLGPAKRFGKT